MVVSSFAPKELFVRNALLLYVNTIGRFNERLGKGASYIIWAICGMLFYEAMSRSIFNAPHAWTNEISSYVFWAYIFLGGGYVLFHDAHVRMDAVYMRWSPRGRAIADAATFSVVAFYLVGMIWKTSFYGYLSIIQGEIQATGIHSYIWPVRVIMVFGIILVFMEAVAFFIKDIHLATRGKVLE